MLDYPPLRPSLHSFILSFSFPRSYSIVSLAPSRFLFLAAIVYMCLFLSLAFTRLSLSLFLISVSTLRVQQASEVRFAHRLHPRMQSLPRRLPPRSLLLSRGGKGGGGKGSGRGRLARSALVRTCAGGGRRESLCLAGCFIGFNVCDKEGKVGFAVEKFEIGEEKRVYWLVYS